MTPTATPDLAAKAQQRLDRLARCSRVEPMQAGDEEMRCLNDSFEVIWSGGHWIHSPAEIQAMRALLPIGWPK